MAEPAAPPVAFSLTPMTVNRDLIDFTDSGNVKMFTKATAALSDDKFDLEPKNLKFFLDKLGERTRDFGWSAILNIPESTGTAGSPTHSLLDEYGSITLEQTKNHVATYIDAKNRMTQDSYLMAKAILESLTKAAHERINLLRSKYVAGTDSTPSGALLLKIVISETHQDTNATTKHIREKLRDLHTYIVRIDSDIIKFNQYVKLQIESLAARGATTEDLLTDLFKAYKQASDQKFVDYIEQKESDYEDGTNFTADQLMTLAQNKYQTKLENGTWNAPTEADEKIIALEAEIKKLQKNKKKGKDDKGKDGKKKDGEKKSGPKEKPAWTKVAPKEGEAKAKTVDGKEFFWCQNHQAWVRHKPEDCRGKGFVYKRGELIKKDAPRTDANKDSKKEASPALRMAGALANLALREDDE